MGPPAWGEVVAGAARSRHDVIRVSAAAAVAVLPPEHATAIATVLLDDVDPGVRIRAAKSAAAVGHPDLANRLHEMASNDPELSVREIAGHLTMREPA